MTNEVGLYVGIVILTVYAVLILSLIWATVLKVLDAWVAWLLDDTND